MGLFTKLASNTEDFTSGDLVRVGNDWICVVLPFRDIIPNFTSHAMGCSAQ